jgi:transposase
MGRTSVPTTQRIEELDKIVRARWTPEVFHRFQCVWLSLVLRLTAAEIAEALSLNISTVRRIRTRFLNEGSRAIVGAGNRGGRRNQYLTFEDEAVFLRDHAELFDRSGAGNVKLLKEAFEAHVGKRVHKTTIYRLLERHGRQKLAAMARKSSPDAGVQTQRKKNSSATPSSAAHRRKIRKVR